MIPSVIYNINWLNFLKMWVPGIRRKPRTMASFLSFTAPLASHHSRFLYFKNDSIYKVSHNASIVKLEKVLNDHFDDNLRRIYIKNITQQDAVRFYSAAAQREVGFYSVPQFGFRSSLDFNPDAADFRVYLPTGLQPVEETELQGLIIRIKAQLDYYKLFAKKYELIWID